MRPYYYFRKFENITNTIEEKDGGRQIRDGLGGDFGMVLESFRDDFGPTLENRKFESSELKKSPLEK